MANTEKGFLGKTCVWYPFSKLKLAKFKVKF